MFPNCCSPATLSGMLLLPVGRTFLSRWGGHSCPPSFRPIIAPIPTLVPRASCWWGGHSCPPSLLLFVNLRLRINLGLPRTRLHPPQHPCRRIDKQPPPLIDRIAPQHAAVDDLGPLQHD